MKAALIIVAVLTILGHMHVPVGHLAIPALWLAAAAELAACAGAVVMIRRAARGRVWRPA
jgi:hypothetical protein